MDLGTMEEYNSYVVASNTTEGDVYISDGWQQLLLNTSAEVYDKIVFTLDFVFDGLFIEFDKSRK